MLVEGQLQYAALYETISAPISSKKHKSMRMELKQSLCRDVSRTYVQNVDITTKDLERKLRTGKDIFNGRQLVAMAKEGMRSYRKALSFTKAKWDLKKQEPKESGTTVDDVFDYVRLKMYQKSQEKSVVNVDTDDDDDDEEVVAASNLERSNKNVSEDNEISTEGNTCNVDDDEADKDDDNKDSDKESEEEDKYFVPTN